MKRFYFLSLFLLSLVFTSCDWYCCGGYYGDHRQSQTEVQAGGITVNTYLSNQDYYGGKTVYYTISNFSGKTISNVYFYIEMRDFYNDKCYCEHCGNYYVTDDFDGPFYHGNTYNLISFERFCNSYACRPHIKQCWVTFSDGSRRELNCGYY